MGKFGTLVTMCDGNQPITVTVTAKRTKTKGTDDYGSPAGTPITALTFVVTNTSTKVWNGIDTNLNVSYGDDLQLAKDVADTTMDNDEVGAVLNPGQSKTTTNGYVVPADTQITVQLAPAADAPPAIITGASS